MKTLNTVFLSASRITAHAMVNKTDTNKMREMIQMMGYSFSNAEGVWQGDREESFIVHNVPDAEVIVFERLATQFNQMAIMVAKPEYLEVTLTQPLEGDYTLDTDHDLYLQVNGVAPIDLYI